MQIAMAYAGRRGAQQDLVILRIVDIDLLDGQGLMRRAKHGSFHK
jgi:hypothetical protein